MHDRVIRRPDWLARVACVIETVNMGSANEKVLRSRFDIFEVMKMSCSFLQSDLSEIRFVNSGCFALHALDTHVLLGELTSQAFDLSGHVFDLELRNGVRIKLERCRAGRMRLTPSIFPSWM